MSTDAVKKIAGHLVMMVRKDIEYDVMAAYADGMTFLHYP